MMTQKDYNLIATAIRKTREERAQLPSNDKTLNYLVENLIDALVSTNPSFDGEVFWEACKEEL